MSLQSEIEALKLGIKSPATPANMIQPMRELLRKLEQKTENNKANIKAGASKLAKVRASKRADNAAFAEIAKIVNKVYPENVTFTDDGKTFKLKISKEFHKSKITGDLKKDFNHVFTWLVCDQTWVSRPKKYDLAKNFVKNQIAKLSSGKLSAKSYVSEFVKKKTKSAKPEKTKKVVATVSKKKVALTPKNAPTPKPKEPKFRSYGKPQSTVNLVKKITVAKAGSDAKIEYNDLNCAAAFLPVKEIRTDTERFQNRKDAFSELSARSVAENYDPNRFDPIVVWKDSKAAKTYVISGHSRLEGMKRRGEKVIPARYFNGTEAQAIQFARVDANRSANQESIVEDIDAYILMRDGSGKLGIEKASKAEIERAFKGKHAKLEAYSFLNPKGLFIMALSGESVNQYPYLETKAQWVGLLRREKPQMTNAQEDECFYYLYGDTSNRDTNKDEFLALVRARLARGGKLFPECGQNGCGKSVSLSDGKFSDEMQRIAQIDKELQELREQLAAKSNTKKIVTDAERKLRLDYAKRLEKEREQIERNIHISESTQQALFGLKKKPKRKRKLTKKASHRATKFTDLFDERLVKLAKKAAKKSYEIGEKVAKKGYIAGKKVVKKAAKTGRQYVSNKLKKYANR
ncbi:ParB-like nuclease domain-containing protein [Flexibacter flexilis DSM 6793]|uniref:ParB-like nuclease domain-containing protein n=1 Tax=Flexibacter flexilis DSM 6793 TaxID=927664 RepID=A0A1I1M693_9BACT|nr:ParB N-terminal domain-containing protein [Flexibacter flexilis]SFC80566.1 ParB-like nuclease domain-containing protein [Flexibacter flexilis DSM 6793]